jgi:hypothetical protein
VPGVPLTLYIRLAVALSGGGVARVVAVDAAGPVTATRLAAKRVSGLQVVVALQAHVTPPPAHLRLARTLTRVLHRENKGL